MTTRGSDLKALGLEQMVSQMPAAVVIVEAPTGRIIHVNDRAREMTERQLGRPIPAELTDDFEIFHLDGSPYGMADWPLVRSITAGERVVDEEYFNVLADGSRLVVRCSASPVYDDEGRLAAGVLVMYDVTEHKRVEERLAHQSRLFESIEDAIVATDEHFLITTWNNGAEAIYGWTADEVIGLEVREVFRVDMSDAGRDALRRRTAEIGQVRIETVSYRKDGTPVDVESINFAVRDDHGQITGYLGIHRDVTERRRAEAHLAYHARLLENLNDAVLATDERYLLTAWNKGAETMFGWTAEEALGRAVYECIPTVYTDEQLADVLQKVSQTGQRFAEGRLWRHKDGSLVCAEARTFAIRGDDGAITGYTSVMRDIAERVRAQDEIEGRARQQAAVAQFGLEALTGGDLPSLMDDAAALIASTLNVDYGKILELLPGGEELLIRAGFGWTKGMVLNQTEPADEGSQAGYTLLSGDPVVTEDLASETRFRVSPVTLELAAASAVSVVIPTLGVPFGVLEALSKHRRTYSDDDVNFLRAIANVLASAAERGESERKLREVRDGERRRIARDLHEGALWGLAHALAEAHRAESALEDTDAAAQLSGLVLALQQVGQQVRGAIYDLRLRDEVGRPFPELLESLLGLHRSTADDVNIELDARDSTPTGPLGRTGTEVLRIVSEALTNARRHSGAHRVRVGVWGTEDTLWVEVSDDGRGFDPAGAPAGLNGAGIDAMRQRATIIGANLQIRSGLGGGTRVRLEVPLRTLAKRPLDEVRILLVEDRAAVRQREHQREDYLAISRLTPRERDVLRALAQGLSSQEIARQLRVALRTERNHMASILAKLGVHSRLQALVFALHYGLVEVWSKVPTPANGEDGEDGDALTDD